MLPPLQATRAKDTEVAQLEQNIAAAIKPVLSVPMLDQNTVTGIVFTGGGSVVVKHGLRTTPSGYFIIRQRLGVPAIAETASDETTITFNSGVACIADMVFFR